MALVARRKTARSTFRYPSSTGSGGLSLADYTARLQAQAQASMQKSDYSSGLTMQRWFEQQQYLLQNREDQDALTRIGQGDGAYGMAYAQRRIDDLTASGGDPRQVAYWQDILTRATEKAQDNAIQGLLASGQMKPEDVLGILNDRLSKENPGSPEFVSLSQQIAQVQNSITSKKVNDYLASAYADYVQSRDPKQYLGALMSVFTQVKEETIRQALTKQINDVQKQVLADEANKRVSAIDTMIVDYYGDRVNNPASTVLYALEQATRLATTPDEAQRYITLAKDITSREQSLGAAAAKAASGGRTSGSAGSGSGVSAAVQEQINAEKANYAAAEQHLKEDILDKGGIPTDGEWAIYWQAGDSRLTTIQNLLSEGGLSASVTKSLNTELTAIQNDRNNYKDKAATNVVSETDRLQTQIGAALKSMKDAKMPEAQMYDQISGLVAKMHQLASSPFLNGEPAAQEKAQINVQQALAPIQSAFDESRAVYADENNAPSMLNLKKAYQAYTEQWANAHPDKPAGGWSDFNAWLNTMQDPALSFDQKAKALGLTHMVPDPQHDGQTIEKPITSFTPSDVLTVSSLLGSAQNEMDAAIGRMRVTFALLKNVSPAEMQYVATDRMAAGLNDPAVNADIARARQVAAAGTDYGGALVGGGGFGGRAGRAPSGLITDPGLADRRLMESLAAPPPQGTYTPPQYYGLTPMPSGGGDTQGYMPASPDAGLGPTFDPGYAQPTQAPSAGYQPGDRSYMDAGAAPAPVSGGVGQDFSQLFGMQPQQTEAPSYSTFDPGIIDFTQSSAAQAADSWLNTPTDISQYLPDPTIFDLPPMPVYSDISGTLPSAPPPTPTFDPGFGNYYTDTSGGGGTSGGEASSGPTLSQ